jgi:hypothetical protein
VVATIGAALGLALGLAYNRLLLALLALSAVDLTL